MHSKRRPGRKTSPFIINIEKVTDLREEYLVSIFDIARAVDFDPSSVGRNLRNESRSLKLQRKIAQYFVKLTKGAVTEADILIRQHNAQKKTAASLGTATDTRTTAT